MINTTSFSHLATDVAYYFNEEHMTSYRRKKIYQQQPSSVQVTISRVGSYHLVQRQPVWLMERAVTDGGRTRLHPSG